MLRRAQAEAEGVARKPSRRLAAAEKAKGAAAAGAAAEVVVEKCDEAAAAGHTSVVVEVPAGVDGKVSASSPRKSTRRTRAWRCSSSRAAAGRWGPSRPCLTGINRFGAGGRVAQRRAGRSAGGAAASRPSRASGSAEAAIRRGRWWRRRGRSRVNMTTYRNLVEVSPAALPGWWWCCHCALHERHPIFVRLSGRA